MSRRDRGLVLSLMVEVMKRRILALVLIVAIGLAACAGRRPSRPLAAAPAAPEKQVTEAAARNAAPPQAAPQPPPPALQTPDTPPAGRGFSGDRGFPAQPPPTTSRPTTPPSTTVPPPRSVGTLSRSPASTSPPVPEVAGSAGFELLQQFVEQMRDGSGALRAEPKRVERGREIDVTLTIAPGVTETDLLARVQSSNAVVATRDAKVAPRMSATLIVPESATVIGDNAEPRAIDGVDGVVWRWRVTPTHEGELRLSAVLTAPVVVDGKDTPYTVKTFDATVTVIVTPSTRAKDFVETNWKWLWTTLIVPVFLWWRQRSLPGSVTPPPVTQA